MPSLCSPISLQTVNQHVPRIAIIGAGITGLSAAQRIVDSGAASVTLFEAADRVGGVIQTTHRDGFLIEHSADSFLVSEELPWAGKLCEQLGVELIETSPTHRGALILKGNTLHPVPDGLQLMTVRSIASIFASPLLSWRGKLRVAAERFVPQKKSASEESLQQFATRRFGTEMFERIVQPLVSGIYTADPAKLSVAAALPQYVALEQKHGSIARAATRQIASNGISNIRHDRGARYGLFRTPIDGMETLINALVHSITESELADLRQSSPVRSVRSQDNSWIVASPHGEETFSGVILATPVTRVGNVVREIAEPLASQTEGIECVSTAVVCLGLKRSKIRHPLNAFGCVVPAVENRRILAISFGSVKFPSRAPNDSVLFRVFVGGALQPDLAELPDDELVKMVREELADILGVEEEPLLRHIVRWPRTTPQYHLGHLDRVAEIEQQVSGLRGLELCGNAYRGVGIPQCVRSGWAAADRMVEVLRSGVAVNRG